VDVAKLDNEEIEVLCLSLDACGTPSPVDGIGWIAAWADGVISSAQVIQAARDDLHLEDE
jgi:hypothetical protein